MQPRSPKKMHFISTFTGRTQPRAILTTVSYLHKKSLKKHWIRLRNFCRQFEKFCKASIFTIFSIKDLKFIVDKNIDFTTDVKLCDCNNLCTCEVSKENITLRFREVYFKLVLLKCNNILVSE